ncbi:MAG: response regulator transcription factor [Eubacteriales bacterium]|nr:response regulator transcription factor [Eubacteriales bacterium]
MNILILEDQKTMREILAEYIKTAGYTVYEAEDGQQAIDILDKEDISLAVLDIMVPKINGIDVLKHIHATRPIPTIMLTALEDEQMQITAFNAMADDYVIKPASPIILIKRIEAILRRSKQQSSEHKGLYLDKKAYMASYNSQDLHLTVSEFLLLNALYEASGKVLNREQLIYAIYENDYFGSDRVIDSHVKNIRKKLPEDLIITVSGVGYKFKEENNEA